jgi:sec-independent protein translocase protein TatA
MIPGLPELLILLAIILLFFGSERVPQLGRSLGSGLQEFRKARTGVGEDGVELENCKKRAEEEEPVPAKPRA